MTKEPALMSDDIALTAAAQFGTPLYLYDLPQVTRRYRALKEIFQNRFHISYAIKCNPNADLLRHFVSLGASFDASSLAEVVYAIAAGADPGSVSFTGPAKSQADVTRSVELGIGTMVLESVRQAEWTSQAAGQQGRVQPCVIRVNPVSVPRAFGARMTGKASQFGIDEAQLADALRHIAALPHLDLQGFHIYAGTNCLDADGCVENFANYTRIFRDHAALLGGPVRTLIFGAGFGIPYYDGLEPLDLAAVAVKTLDLAADPLWSGADLSLELGRWLVGSSGRLLTQVVAEKATNGVELRLCDAGFNNQLAACGMMGSVIRRNYRMANLTGADRTPGEYTLTGPLCTSIDVLAKAITLPEPVAGDVLAVENSGAYGYASSPHQFIGHPTPREVIWDGETLRNSPPRAPRHPGDPI